MRWPTWTPTFTTSVPVPEEPHGLLEAADDERLLGFPLWPKQRELLAAVEAGPRLHCWALGRRSGKTTLSALVALWDCLLRPELAGLVRPGERRYAVAVATNLRQARLFVSAARSLVERSPLLGRMAETVTDDEIAFANGTALAAFPCTSRGARGWPISCLLLDEAAHMLDTEGNSAAEQVYRALVPSTAQFGDLARTIVASTPYGADGLFAELHAKAAAGELEDAHAAQATSAEMNPTLDPAFLSREHARDPEGFRGEYLAEFVGSGGAYLDANRLAAVVVDRGELDRLDADQWRLGCDLGFQSDPTGAVLVGSEPGNPDRLLVGLVRKWAPQRSATFEERRAVEDSVLADVAEIARYYDAKVIVDQHMAPQVSSLLARRGVHVSTLSLSATSKSLAFAELRARVNAETIELPDHPDLLADLRGLRSRFAAGRADVVTPRTARGHSDVAVALALAVWEARNAANADLYGGWHTDNSPPSGAFGDDHFLRGPWLGM